MCDNILKKSRRESENCASFLFEKNRNRTEKDNIRKCKRGIRDAGKFSKHHIERQYEIQFYI